MNFNIFRFAYDFILTFIDLGRQVYEFATRPLLPPDALEYLEQMPDWVLSWSGLESWSDITLIWVLGAGFVIFAVLTVIKWVIGIVM